MAVYVDEARYSFGNMLMCHLWADTLDELLEMVDKIGVQRKWIQGHPTLSFGKHCKASWVHFDIAKSKRTLAVKAGAIECDKYGPAEHVALIQSESYDPFIAARGRKQLVILTSARINRSGLLAPSQAPKQNPNAQEWLRIYRGGI